MFVLAARADYSVLHTMENECCYWGNVGAKNDRGHDHPLLISYCIRNLSLSSQRWKKKSEKMEKQKETNCITPHSHHRKSRESTNMELMREFLKTEFISSSLKHVQSHLTLCNPMDCSPPVSSIHGFPRQDCWSELPFPSPGDVSDPGTEPMAPASPALAGGFFTTEPLEKA